MGRWIVNLMSPPASNVLHKISIFTWRFYFPIFPYFILFHHVFISPFVFSAMNEKWNKRSDWRWIIKRLIRTIVLHIYLCGGVQRQRNISSFILIGCCGKVYVLKNIDQEMTSGLLFKKTGFILRSCPISCCSVVG